MGLIEAAGVALTVTLAAWGIGYIILAIAVPDDLDDDT